MEKVGEIRRKTAHQIKKLISAGLQFEKRVFPAALSSTVSHWAKSWRSGTMSRPQKVWGEHGASVGLDRNKNSLSDCFALGSSATDGDAPCS